jgi:RNA polymerase sigma-70 factor (ECF subfamily)
LEGRAKGVLELWHAICHQSDSTAFESLFASHYSRLFNFCLLYIHQKEAAEEIVSDVFVKCWISRASLNHVLNPEVYLFVAVKNHALNYLKRFSNYRIVGIDEANADQLINSLYPGKELEKNELFFKMNQAIDSLPRQCRIIFRLIKEDGMKYKEVAEILHISPRTVQTQLVRAIEKLRRVMRPYIESRDDQAKTGNIILPVVLFLLFSIFF